MVDLEQFGAILVWLVADLIALDRDPVIQHLLLGVRGQVAAGGYRNTAGKHLAEDDEQEPPGCEYAHRYDEDERSDQAVVKPEYDLAEPVAAVGMLLCPLRDEPLSACPYAPPDAIPSNNCARHRGRGLRRGQRLAELGERRSQRGLGQLQGRRVVNCRHEGRLKLRGSQVDPGLQ